MRTNRNTSLFVGAIALGLTLVIVGALVATNLTLTPMFFLYVIVGLTLPTVVAAGMAAQVRRYRRDKFAVWFVGTNFALLCVGIFWKLLETNVP